MNQYLKIIISGVQLAVMGIFTFLFYKLLLGDKICWYENSQIIAGIELTLFGIVTIFTLIQFIKSVGGKK